MSSNVEELTQINLDDLVSSVGWQDRPLLTQILRNLFQKPARTFAEIVMEFDSAIAELGLVEASRLTIDHFVRDVRVFGQDHIPDSAFLALSNHPGMSDTISLFCALNRPNLKIIALDRPFLTELPNLSRQLFYLKEDSSSRMTLVRQVTSHLRAGGAALTFPAGQIEPDPELSEGEVNSLQAWTDSAGVFIRMAPDTAILPILVRGVIWDKMAKHILLRIKKEKEEKEKLAAALQLLAHIVFKIKDVHVRIQIGRPIYAKDLGTNETAIIHQAVLAEMKHLIENPPAGDGVSVLVAR
ncbi:MAG TPA: 1-acyl-sn-glycerol-3-phosphate acyltransferase [Anaerolineales bacterium]|nr:1-acyl-sn-glycerol-3-phosphate acyltransferase [Anaerolineales bacterium]